MYYDFECIIKDSNQSNKNKKHILMAFGIYIKSDHPDILEDKFESYRDGVAVDWFIIGMSYYNEFFKDIFNINIPLNEDSITPLYTSCYYCNDEKINDIVRDHDLLNGKFRGYAHNKCNLQDKNKFLPIYAFNSTNYDNHLFITKLAKKIRLEVLTETDENYNCFGMGHAKELDMFRFFHPLSLDARSKTLCDKEYATLNKYGLETRKVYTHMKG